MNVLISFVTFSFWFIFHYTITHTQFNNNHYEILITADHGNAELMYANKQNNSETMQPHTAHTNNLVPMIYIGTKNFSLNAGDLKDIAPTMLSLMGLEIPKEMSGKSLISN